jgi:PPM family protein phosphatase
MNVEGAIKVARLTDVGQMRDHNEDAVASDLSVGLLVLADGMGGYRAGEVASEIAVLTIAAEITEAMRLNPLSVRNGKNVLPETNMLVNAVANANAAIYQISQEQPQCAGMGTTLVTAVFTNNTLIVGHIGDSRMYMLRDSQLTQLTEDHSLLQEQINAGLISLEQAKIATHKNLVTRALGIDPEVTLDLTELDVKIGDIYLLCSDGLSDLVEDTTIAEVLIEASVNIAKDSLENAAAKLVQLANEMGGKDNISVIIAKIQKSFEVDSGWMKNIFNKAKKTKK